MFSRVCLVAKKEKLIFVLSWSIKYFHLSVETCERRRRTSNSVAMLGHAFKLDNKFPQYNNKQMYYLHLRLISFGLAMQLG